jgi:hypothetical protein
MAPQKIINNKKLRIKAIYGLRITKRRFEKRHIETIATAIMASINDVPHSMSITIPTFSPCVFELRAKNFMLN